MFAVMEHNGSRCNGVFVYIEQLGGGVEIEACDAGYVAVGCIVVFAEDDTRGFLGLVVHWGRKLCMDLAELDMRSRARQEYV